MDVLSEAHDVLHGDRQRDYGSPSENLARIAEMWSAYLDCEVTARDVAMLNILQKVSRDRATQKRDNLVDIAGYAAAAEECEPPEPRRFVSRMDMHAVDSAPGTA